MSDLRQAASLPPSLAVPPPWAREAHPSYPATLQWLEDRDFGCALVVGDLQIQPGIPGLYMPIHVYIYIVTVDIYIYNSIYITIYIYYIFDVGGCQSALFI